MRQQCVHHVSRDQFRGNTVLSVHERLLTEEEEGQEETKEAMKVPFLYFFFPWG